MHELDLWRRRRAQGCCGAQRKRDGLACAAAAMANGRCRMHGGASTGPRTPAGKRRALANLLLSVRRQGRARRQVRARPTATERRGAAP